MLIGAACRSRDALHGTARRVSLRFVAVAVPLVACWLQFGVSVSKVHSSTHPQPSKGSPMSTRTAPRLIAFIGATFLTLVTLTSLDILATSEPSAAQLARVAATQQA
jgi:hypothetical protein